MNVLVVDDSASIRSRLRELLSTLAGVGRVDTTASASEARRLLQTAPPDVVVIDLHLPGGSGMEVLDALASMRERVTAIVLTNDPTPQSRDRCLRAGADFFFDKSAEFRRAIDIIAGLARGRSAPRSHLSFCWSWFERLPIPTWVLDADTLTFQTVNEAAVRRYEYSRQEFLAMTLADIRMPEEQPVGTASIAQQRADAIERLGGPQMHRAKDGSIIHVEITATTFERAGRGLDLVLAHDVGNRLATEEALRASETRYRELFENATDAIFTMDLDLNFTALNSAAEALIGYTRERAKGLNMASITSRETLDDVRRKLAEQAAGRPPSVYETEIRAADGRSVPIEVIARLVVRDGTPLYIQGMARDISDRKRLEQGLRQAQKMEAVGRLAGGVAHDFNNLLTVIVGYSQDIIDRLPPDDPIRADVLQIVNAGGYAVDLTRQLLAFSRQQTLASTVLDLNAVLDQLTPMLGRLIGADIELEIHAAPDASAVKADPGQLEQVIVNLVVNARDAMPQGGTLTVRTSTVVVDARAAERPGLVPGQYVLLSLSDTGNGMDGATKAQIFEPFFTTKDAGQGTGLGLCTVDSIVKQSGGYIFVDSEPGRGTTFRLYFPHRPASEIAQASATPTVRREVGGTESILLVDDDRGVCEFARRVLAARGYAVLTAASANEAQQLCASHGGAIDLLIADVVIPGITGPALASVMRVRYPNLKIAYTSGYSTGAVGDQRLLDPSVPFIAKPFTAQGLASKVREALDRA